MATDPGHTVCSPRRSATSGGWVCRVPVQNGRPRSSAGPASPRSEGVILFVDRALRALLSLGGGAVSALLRGGAHYLSDGFSAGGAQPTQLRADVADVFGAHAPSQTQGPSQTVAFGLDGQNYQIDLHPDEANELRSALQRYVSAGRRTDDQPAGPSVTGGARPRRAAQTTHANDSAAIRAWAQAHGRPVAGRGRIPSTVLHAYEAAHPRGRRRSPT